MNRHHKLVKWLASALSLAAAAALLITSALVMAPTADASSHREAPLIAQDPTADSTDVYAFLSPDGPGPARWWARRSARMVRPAGRDNAPRRASGR